jgi:hypothetical protein
VSRLWSVSNSFFPGRERRKKVLMYKCQDIQPLNLVQPTIWYLALHALTATLVCVHMKSFWANSLYLCSILSFTTSSY